MFKETARIIEEEICSWEGRDLLNIGSGDVDFYRRNQPYVGKLMDYLDRKGFSIHNMDLKINPDEHHFKHCAGDAAVKIPYPDGCFPLIFCLSMLEHVLYPQKVISEVRRVLDKDGFVFFEIPAVYPHHPDPIDTGLRAKSMVAWEQILSYEWLIDRYWYIEEPNRGTCSMVRARKVRT